MKQFTIEEIQEQFEKLPKISQEAVESVEISRTIQEIGERHGLHIDQIGELVHMIGLVMLGLMPSGEFVNNFVAESGVSSKTAMELAEEINHEVFSNIRTTMRSAEQNKQSANDISALEKAGGFSVEKSDEGDTTVEGGIADGHNSGAAVKKSDIIAAIENSGPSRGTVERSGSDNNFSEPMIDYLLETPNASHEAKITQKPETTVPPNLPTGSTEQGTVSKLPNKVNPPISKPKGSDMYREPVE